MKSSKKMRREQLVYSAVVWIHIKRTYLRLCSCFFWHDRSRGGKFYLHRSWQMKCFERPLTA